MSAERASGRVAPPSFAGPPAARRDEPALTANRERYSHEPDNRFRRVGREPLSTFSVDVDTASYSNARRFISGSQLPPPDAIRTEEWINYFTYDYPAPRGEVPFSVTTEVSTCPWNEGHELARIGLRGRPISEEQVPARNLVFLIDVSGSMMPANRLPLLKSGLSLLVRSLRPHDSIAMVVYAGSSGLVLPATEGTGNQAAALEALERLDAGGSTNGGDGIRLAYSVAEEHFKKGGINRVILATDGDFNVGTTSEEEVGQLIEAKRRSGVFLTVLGFGEGNLNDRTMERLADKGNGNYAYIDSLYEAKKVLVREAGATLVTRREPGALHREASLQSATGRCQQQNLRGRDGLHSAFCERVSRSPFCGGGRRSRSGAPRRPRFDPRFARRSADHCRQRARRRSERRSA